MGPPQGVQTLFIPYYQHICNKFNFLEFLILFLCHPQLVWDTEISDKLNDNFSAKSSKCLKIDLSPNYPLIFSIIIKFYIISAILLLN